MSAHAARAGRGTDIRRDSHSLELLMSLTDSRPDRHPLRTRPHGVRCILNIHTIDKLAIVCEDAGADPESRVRTVGSVFGGTAARVKSVELIARDAILSAGLRDLRGVAGREELHDHCFVCGRSVGERDWRRACIL